jgi:hypothetical protein
LLGDGEGSHGGDVCVDAAASSAGFGGSAGSRARGRPAERAATPQPALAVMEGAAAHIRTRAREGVVDSRALEACAPPARWYSSDLVPLYAMFSDFVLSSSYVMDLVWVVLL